jgi:hypothetical protein
MIKHINLNNWFYKTLTGEFLRDIKLMKNNFNSKKRKIKNQEKIKNKKIRKNKTKRKINSLIKVNTKIKNNNVQLLRNFTPLPFTVKNS